MQSVERQKQRLGTGYREPKKINFREGVGSATVVRVTLMQFDSH